MEEPTKSKLLPGALILSGLEGLGVLVHIVLTKSAEGGLFLGLSTSRLALAAGTLAISLTLLYLGITWKRKSQITTRIRNFVETRSKITIFILSWTFIAFFIIQREPFFQVLVRPLKPFYTIAYYQRFQLILIWLTLMFLQLSTAVFLCCKRQLRETSTQDQPFLPWIVFSITVLFSPGNKDKKQHPFRSLWQNHKASLLIYLGILILWVGIAITDIGLLPDDRFWNIAGVPILWHQIVLVGLLVLFLLDLQKIGAGSKLVTISQKPIFPVIVFLLIWAAAILIWQGEPLTHTFFSPEPYPPNNVRYPFSDARWFDIGGQYFLMGKGLYNYRLTDRPYLMLHTAFLHLLGGQDYDLLATFQVILLALIPALLFLLGWKLLSKTAGLAIALLIIFKEKNAIASAFKIGISNPKVLTSELPNALLLVLTTVCLFYWFQESRQKALWPILAGGFAGWAVGVRGNSLTIIPLILLLALLAALKHQNFLKQWLIASVFFLLGAGVVLAPYSIETTQKFGAPFWIIKIQNVINRSEAALLPDNAVSSRLNKLVQEEPPAAVETDPDGFIKLTLRHFLHNEITTVLMLPIQWEARPIPTSIEHPIWDSKTIWQGELSLGEGIALGVNLLILAFGIGYGFRRWGITGLVPLGIHLTYNLTSSAARTSGGRYLIPIDWVLSVYFILGLISMIYSLRQWQITHPPARETASPGKGKFGMPIFALLGFLLIGSAFLFSDLIPQRYEITSQHTLWHYLDTEIDQMTESGISRNDIESFVETEGAVFSLGMTLYPRYYEAGAPTLQSSYLPDIPPEDARLYFLMLEDGIARHVSLPMGEQVPTSFPHGAYGLILGCQKEGYTQGLLFIPLDAPDSQILMHDDLVLICQ